MNHHADHSVFGGFTVCAIGLASAVIKANHRIFHPVTGFNTLCYWVGVGDGEMRIALYGMRHHFGTIPAVKVIRFFWVGAHTHHLFAFYISRHGIPGEFPAAAPGKIAYHIGLENPGLFSRLFLFFLCFCLIEGNNFNHIFSRLGFLPTAHFLGRKYLFIVLALPRSHHNMIRRNGDAYPKVSKRKRKFARAGELVVLPSLEIAIHTEPWIPLGNGE